MSQRKTSFERRIIYELNCKNKKHLAQIQSNSFEYTYKPFLRVTVDQMTYPFKSPVVLIRPPLHRVLHPSILNYLNGDVLQLIKSFLREPWMSPKSYILEVGDSNIQKDTRWDLVNTFHRYIGENWTPSMFIIDILKNTADIIEIAESIK